MSMKRSKEVSRGRARDVEGGFWEKKEPERVYTFEGDVAVHPDDAFAKYAPVQRYEKNALIDHPKFGKGIVTGVDAQKIDVLFRDGWRKLTHALAGGAVLPRPKPQPAPEPAAEPTPAEPALDPTSQPVQAAPSVEPATDPAREATDESAVS